MTDNYQLLQCIGRGGMGEVWRARHKMLGREVAIKLIRPEALVGRSDARGRITLRRFEKEARATAALRSPHTVELYDFGLTEDGTFFYAMELLEGYDLQTLVELHGPLPPARVVHLLRQVCESLAEAHHRGLVHRDVKPANVFTCQLGLEVDFVKVLDFGLVKGSASGEGSSDTNLTVDGAVPGSPAFMSPEAIRAEGDLDGKTDLYSLGCVAYWLLTGSRVFEGRTALDLVLAHLQSDASSPSALLEAPLPAQLEAVVLECLAKDPDERPASAEEVSRRLASVRLAEPWDEDRAKAWWREHPPPEPGPVADEEDARKTAPTRAAPQLPAVDPSEQAWFGSDGPPGGEDDDVISADWETVAPDGGPESPVEPLGPPPEDLSVEAVVNRLQQHFDRSHIDVFEYDRRTEQAQLAEPGADLRGVLEGLPALDVPGEAVPAPLERSGGDRDEERLPVPAQAGLPVPAGEAYKPMIAVFSGAIRKGVWRPAPRTRLVAVFGGAELDFRQAKLAPGMTEINCRCIFGGAKIVVPPDLHVLVEGVGVFGAFTETGDLLDAPPDDTPWLKVTGVAVFGGVEVEVKEPKKTLGERLRKLLPG